MKIRMGLFALVIAVVALILACTLPVIIQGPTGLTGPQGPQGVQGDVGLQGIQGIQGLPGINGSVGPQGEKGDTGENGTQGIPGDIRGEWVLVNSLSGLGSLTFTLSPNSPVKVYWIATSLENDSCLIVSMMSFNTSKVAIWSEIAFTLGETIRDVDISLVNPNEPYTLSIQAKRGSFIEIHADVYRWASSP